MLSNVFLLKICINTTIAHATTSGIPKGNDKKDTPLRQYTTSIPIIEYGKTLPRYFIYSGVSLSLNIQNGKNLNNAVTIAIIATIAARYPLFILFPLDAF